MTDDSVATALSALLALRDDIDKQPLNPDHTTELEQAIGHQLGVAAR